MRIIPCLLASISFILGAQVVAPNATGVSMGHLHLNARDPELQKKLWTEVLGAEPAKLGPMDVYKLPGTIVIVNKAASPAGTVESSVNHIGVKVRDLTAAGAKVDAAQYKVVNRNDQQIMFDGPDDLRVELTLDPQAEAPVMNHHIHFYTPDLEATREWYVSRFGAIPGMRGKFVAADLPGVNLSFTKSPGPVAGTKGRSLDHIGFEVRNLEAFTKKLEASGVKFDIPYRKVERLGIAVAFFTDPWGTYVELTEGLNQIH